MREKQKSLKSGVSVVMEPDFALRVLQQQIDNFYGYRHKAGQIERSFKL